MNEAHNADTVRHEKDCDCRYCWHNRKAQCDCQPCTWIRNEWGDLRHIDGLVPHE